MEIQDRISILPDEILCRILSFLPTHEAIATSLLSKRWKPLWLSVPILDLDEQTFIRNGRSYSSFFNFAYGALLSHNVQQPLTFARFWLDRHVCGNYNNFPYSLFKIWVNAVVQRGVEHLHIQTPRSVLVSSTILSCKTLVVLKLYRSRINFLGKVHLPALKTLHLDYFFTSETRYLVEVLHGCPILEDLRVHYVFVDKKSNVVEFQVMPQLVRANMNVYFAAGMPLKVVSNVEYLKFYLERDKECFPMFYNLVHLELHLCFDIQWDVMFEMLDHCPKLQNLGLRMPLASLPCKNWICPKFVPECISSHLRKCTILNYNGRKSEQQFAKYILQNSRALQTMTIDDVGKKHSSNHMNKLEMLQELAMFPKSSTTCRLLFK